ncbi:uncharacterized protein LOC125764099 [Anopheles funestus]|uniref:uncharacterized protein LOC125764099 n=1 Tax=Anopheles funestus TaxID=62324 RepID=UPI0020C726C4|nr:uncharacterized protein LOC125764099 [Anopheles funestus]
MASNKRNTFQLTNSNFRIGMFVSAPGHPVALVLGECNDGPTHKILLLSSGELVTQPVGLCRIIEPPTNPNRSIFMNRRVRVTSGEMEGVYGVVLGIHNDLAYVCALEGLELVGNTPRNPTNDVCYFFENVSYLKIVSDENPPRM